MCREGSYMEDVTSTDENIDSVEFTKSGGKILFVTSADLGKTAAKQMITNIRVEHLH